MADKISIIEKLMLDAGVEFKNDATDCTFDQFYKLMRTVAEHSYDAGHHEATHRLSNMGDLMYHKNDYIGYMFQPNTTKP